MTPENAEILALKALEWMVSQESVFQVFLNITGVAVNELATRTADPEFLGSVLEFLMGNDKNIVEFASAAGIEPETVAQARAALPGGEVVHWT